jgi:hypothetical protein
MYLVKDSLISFKIEVEKGGTKGPFYWTQKGIA